MSYNSQLKLNFFFVGLIKKVIIGVLLYVQFLYTLINYTLQLLHVDFFTGRDKEAVILHLCHPCLHQFFKCQVFLGSGGKVLEAMPASGKVIVEGVNVATCHVKPRKQGEEGGIIRREIPLYACKVMRVCPKCGKATRPAYKVADGKKVRVCKKCGQTI